MILSCSRTETLAKVASGPAAVASLGAPFASLANITSALLPQLPPVLQTYLDTSIDSVSSALTCSVAYLQASTGLSPTVLYSTIGALVVGAASTVAAKKGAKGASATKSKKKKKKRKAANSKTKDMRRFWSTGQGSHSVGVPNVTDSDYEYIGSDELQNDDYDPQPVFDYGTENRSGGSYFRPPNDDDLNDIPQDDVLLFRRDNKISKEFFPPYSIGDGKLYTSDVRDRVQLLYKLSDAQTEGVKLFYKKEPLKIEDQPICLNGVKNNSEIQVLVSPEDDESISSAELSSRKGSKPKPKKSKRKSGRTSAEQAPSSSAGLEVPRGRDSAHLGSSSRASSAVSGISKISTSKTPAAPGSPMDKLNQISSHFEEVLLPLCEQFVAQPPSDPKKRADEHRKISETTMQQVILKLDEVDTGGDSTVRARRKELVTQVQNILKEMDKRLDKKATS